VPRFGRLAKTVGFSVPVCHAVRTWGAAISVVRAVAGDWRGFAMSIILMW